VPLNGCVYVFHGNQIREGERLVAITVLQVIVAVKRPLSTLVEYIHDILSKLPGVSCVISMHSSPELPELYVFFDTDMRVVIALFQWLAWPHP